MNAIFSWWRFCWEGLDLHVRRLGRYQRLRNDYLKITSIPPKAAGCWMGDQARLGMPSEKEVEAVGSESCQKKIYY